MKEIIEITLLFCIGWILFLFIGNLIKPYFLKNKLKLLRRISVIVLILMLICYKMWDSYYAELVSTEKHEEIKQGSIVVLTEGGCVRLAKSYEIDSLDITLGIIKNYEVDTIIYNSDTLYTAIGTVTKINTIDIE